MRKIEAFNKGKKDGVEGKDPDQNFKGGKTAYVLGWQQGRMEWDQNKLMEHLGKTND